MTPERVFVAGTVCKLYEVTMPKQFSPAASAAHISVFSVALARTISPDPSTSSNSKKESAANALRAE
jgi:hypothetical protein